MFLKAKWLNHDTGVRFTLDTNVNTIVFEIAEFEHNTREQSLDLQ